MGPQSYMRSVVDPNLFMQRMTVQCGSVIFGSDGLTLLKYV